MEQEWFECKKYPGFSINRNGDLKNNSTGNWIKRYYPNNRTDLVYHFSCKGKAYTKK